MGKVSLQLVITGLERRGRLKGPQPGNYKWVIVIQGINAAGWAIPPFIIFASKYHLSTWYQEDILRNQVIIVSDNSQTINELRVAWLEHFITYIKDYRVGTQQLLIINGHKSYSSLEFQDIYKENKIYTLYMPPYSSHLLQPLNVGCFSPLKRAYGYQISSLIQSHINHITKLKFLLVFYATY